MVFYPHNNDQTQLEHIWNAQDFFFIVLDGGGDGGGNFHSFHQRLRHRSDSFLFTRAMPLHSRLSMHSSCIPGKLCVFFKNQRRRRHLRRRSLFSRA